MTRTRNNHYSPVFANKPWSDGYGYISYFQVAFKQIISKSNKGTKQWGRKKDLYTQEIENSLNKDLENDVGPIYESIITFNELSLRERNIWSQFLLSQLVRTPTYMKYEKKVREMFNIKDKPKHDRVGCDKCDDIRFVSNRDWCLLVAHKDDFFVRSDNPIFQTGFIQLPQSCLFYPLTPKICFVACSMFDNWNAVDYKPNETVVFVLEKGDSHLINFYLAKSAGETLILHSEHDGVIADKMYKDALGAYPQPPFSLHNINKTEDLTKSYESIRRIMSITDNIEYPEWNSKEIGPFYQNRDYQ